MIRLAGVSARAGSFRLADVSVTLPAGSWGIVLGPAGAGKTTLLETICGVRQPTAGRIALRGADVTDLPAERRGVGMVYQHGYLFPHLSVMENVRYGARDSAWASDMADRFGAAELRDRPVRALSGGERQIVALARALAPRPDILLLDEPFAALDPRRRTRIRLAVQALQREEGITVLQVTHDFGEAGTLGDVALLMAGGRLVQSAPPEQLFRRPATASAAEFLGAENIFAGTARAVMQSTDDGPDSLSFDAGPFSLVAVGHAQPGAAHAVIRGGDVTISRELSAHSSARNTLRGRVVEVATAGILSRVTLDVHGLPLVAIITASAVAELELAVGVEVLASVKASAVHLC